MPGSQCSFMEGAVVLDQAEFMEELEQENIDVRVAVTET